jgi:type II secretory pathway component PulK
MQGFRSSQGGFVLVLVLWLMAVLTIAASYFSLRVERAVALARDAKTNGDAHLDMANARAEILFRLATTPLSVAGLGSADGAVIALDGRPYRAEGNTALSLQDDRGLLNLNVVSDDRLTRLLGLLGVAPEKRLALIDLLRDYLDEDDLRRLNGGESREYEEAGLPPPRNAPLLTPYEPRRILGWASEGVLWEDDALPRLATTSASVALNPNTAPWQVLATLPGVTNEVAQAVLARRRIAPFRDISELAAVLRVPVAQLMFEVITLPSETVRVTQYVPGAAWAVSYNVTLTPTAPETPWRIGYFHRIKSHFAKDVSSSKLADLPQRHRGPLARAPTLPGAP